jgi:hypothetical protein
MTKLEVQKLLELLFLNCEKIDVLKLDGTEA